MKRISLIKYITLCACAACFLSCKSVDKDAKNQRALEEIIADITLPKEPPHEGGLVETKDLERLKGLIKDGYHTDPLSRKAIDELYSLGPSIFPELVPYLKDKRYIYSTFYPSREPYMLWHNHDLDDLIVAIFCNSLDDEHFLGARDSVGDLILQSRQFEVFMKEAGGPEKWAQEASAQTRQEISLSYIDWCISKEEMHGFESEEERQQVLGGYWKVRNQIKQGQREHLTFPVFAID